MLSLGSARSKRAIAAGLLTAMVLLCGGGSAYAAGGVTGVLRGTTIDDVSGKPIAGVTVSARGEEGTFRATTDAKGFFSFLELPSDTYTVAFANAAYAPYSITGVTVFGDETQSVGVVKLTAIANLKTIGATRVVSRSSSAFQPNQTTDETTLTGQRVDQALGEKGSTDFNSLVLSAPGVIATSPGSLNAFSIRGSASVEIGYQFDGVDFRGSFFDENPNQGYLNGVGGGHGGLQVVSGAGDATQGGIGAGVVNVIPGRGSYPGDGFVSLDVSSPWYDHALAFQYGTGTRDGRFSDFFSMRSDRSAPQIAPYGRDASDAGAYFGPSFTYDDDVLNNFYYRFGRNQDQQVQVLADWLDHRSWGNYGGLGAAAWYPYNPLSYQQFQNDNNGNPMWPNNSLTFYQSIIPYLGNTPKTNIPVLAPEQYIFGPTNFLKIGYTREIDPSTAMETFFYNWGGLNASNITGNSSDFTDGSNLPGYNLAGGRRVGFQSQLTKQFGEKHTVTLVAKFENGFPYWDQQNHGNTWQGLLAGRSLDCVNVVNSLGSCGNSSQTGVCTPVPGTNCSNAPRIEDWFLPTTLGQPVSATNPCIGPAVDNGFSPSAPTNMGCYLYSWLLAHNKWTGQLPALPTTGWDYNNTDFQQFGIGLRDQWTPNARTHLDYGVRMDGQTLKWGANPYNADLGNTADVGLGYATLSNSYLRPRIVEPRISLDYLLTPRDSVRASFGRSVSFFFGQTAGTPSAMANVNPILFQIPAKDSTTINPAAGLLGPACGSGWHGPGSNGNGTYVQNPYNYFSGAGVVASNGWFFKCPNYAESLYWLFDQAYSAPDIGGQNPATYNNWDVAWEHQFKSGWGTKLTSYWRRGFDTYQTTLLNAGPPDPVTGQQTAGSFQERETGIQKAFGLEFMLTTPDRAFGWSGFLSADYINELTSTPPVSGSDSLPVVAQYLQDTGTLFHQAFLPPISARAGIQYKTKSGWRINPILSFDGGEPFGVGATTLGFVNGVLYTLPTGNVGVATPYAGPGLPNQAYNATCYVDPAFAGSYLHPKDAACRGYSEPQLAGQKFTRPRLYSDLNLEYAHHNVTYGIYVSNLFDNTRGQPQVNGDWQPVATGVGGVQTGQYPGAYPLNLDGTPNLLYTTGGRNESAYDQYWLPYQEYYVPGRTFRFYVQFGLGK